MFFLNKLLSMKNFFVLCGIFLLAGCGTTVSPVETSRVKFVAAQVAVKNFATKSECDLKNLKTQQTNDVLVAQNNVESETDSKKKVELEIALHELKIKNYQAFKATECALLKEDLKLRTEEAKAHVQWKFDKDDEEACKHLEALEKTTTKQDYEAEKARYEKEKGHHIQALKHEFLAIEADANASVHKIEKRILDETHSLEKTILDAIKNLKVKKINETHENKQAAPAVKKK